ncbi:hypothetical protein [Xaviernesmea oryzae]|uniref:hypothetical protein n=1 Tax=Xaviernesmea oryzae TaxID=464029 RepID=UPI00111364AA|nr:hypothetical protein [Xaviernesmea oryzae]
MPGFAAGRLDRLNSTLRLEGTDHLKGQDVILVACDPAYFRRYALSFIKSLALIGKAFCVHLHLLQPDQTVLDEVDRLRRLYRTIRLSTTIDPLDGLDLPRRLNIYYNAARFVGAPRLLDLGVERLLILDIDTIARSCPWETLDAVTAQAAFNFRPHKAKPWQKIIANAVYYRNTPLSRDFAGRLARVLLAGLAAGPHYHLDQILPHYLLQIGARSFAAGIASVPADLISLDYAEDASLWTAKGADKASARFLAERARIDAMALPAANGRQRA